MHDTNMLRMNSFDTIVCGYKSVFRLNRFLTFIKMTSGQGTILRLSENVDIKSACLSGFGLMLSESVVVMNACLLPSSLTDQWYKISWELLCVCCLKLRLYLWDRIFGFKTTDLEPIMEKMGPSCYTLHVLLYLGGARRLMVYALGTVI